MRIVTLLVVLLPVAGLVVGSVLLYPVAFNWPHLVLLAVMYLLTGFGVTVGYHRLFTHRSFEANPVLRAVLGILGSMAVEGPLIDWVANHRCHHQHSDQDGDPHSPHSHGAGFRNMLRGIAHAHMGWFMASHASDRQRYAPDLMKDPMIRTISRLFPLWVALGLLIPAVVGGLMTMSWYGALLGFLWGGLVRVLFVHHVTWSVNSVCHIWGHRAYETRDESRNNPVCGILALGEGWHNNHHAFPTSARHGLRWWQFDLSFLLIRVLSWMGLVRGIRVPSADRLKSKRSED
ncbi:MAG: acyl-CoA desaturase [Phycisphaerales bacterium]